jgi:hypothetical protein
MWHRSVITALHGICDLRGLGELDHSAGVRECRDAKYLIRDMCPNLPIGWSHDHSSEPLLRTIV